MMMMMKYSLGRATYYTTLRTLLSILCRFVNVSPVELFVFYWWLAPFVVTIVGSLTIGSTNPELTQNSLAVLLSKPQTQSQTQSYLIWFDHSRPAVAALAFKRIEYKLLSLTYNVLTTTQPSLPGAKVLWNIWERKFVLWNYPSPPGTLATGNSSWNFRSLERSFSVTFAPR